MHKICWKDIQKTGNKDCIAEGDLSHRKPRWKNWLFIVFSRELFELYTIFIHLLIFSFVKKVMVHMYEHKLLEYKSRGFFFHANSILNSKIINKTTSYFKYPRNLRIRAIIQRCVYTRLPAWFKNIRRPWNDSPKSGKKSLNRMI